MLDKSKAIKLIKKVVYQAQCTDEISLRLAIEAIFVELTGEAPTLEQVDRCIS